MKTKTLLILIALVCFAFFLPSCTHSCTCVNPETEKVTDIDINPSESCSDYSNSTRGNCS